MYDITSIDINGVYVLLELFGERRIFGAGNIRSAKISFQGNHKEFKVGKIATNVTGSVSRVVSVVLCPILMKWHIDLRNDISEGTLLRL